MDVGKFRTDEKLSIEGVWKDIGEGARIKVAAGNNPNFRKKFRELTEPFQDLINHNLLDETTSRNILVECTAETVFLGFEGLTDGGKKLADSTAERKRLLLELPALRDVIAAIADRMENFKKVDEAKSLGNSGNA